MSKQPISFYITDNGRDRRILRLETTSSGSVIINIYSGGQEGIPPHHRVIKSRKYSVHPSNSVPDKNGIHYTMTYDDGADYEHYNWTSAIKSRSGFASIFCELFTKLKASHCNMRNKHYKSAKMIGNFNFDKECLMVYLFVGHKDAETEEIVRDDTKVFEHVAGEFKFLIFTHRVNAPATLFSWHVPKVTQDPRQMPDGREKELALMYAEGTDWNMTMFIFDLWRVRLYKRYLQDLIEYPPEVGAAEWALLELSSFPSDEEIFRPYGWSSTEKLEASKP